MTDAEKVLNITKEVTNRYAAIRKQFRSLIAIKQLPITTTQLACLRCVEQSGDITMSKLAVKMNMSNQQLTKVVDNLVLYQVIERKPDEKNRRQIFVAVTKKGEQILDNLQKEVVARVTTSVEKNFSPEEIEKIYNAVMYLAESLDKII